MQQENLGERPMKIAIGTALLVLLAGATTYAQEQEKEKPAQQEKKQEPAAKEHSQAQEHEKGQEREKAQQQQQKNQEHQAQEQQKNQTKQVEKEKSDATKQQQQAAKQQQQQQQHQQQGAKQQQVAHQQQQQQIARQDHANAQQAQRDGGNRNAHRISEQDFHAHFGREHHFRVSRSEDHRFNYGGYYWVYNDPWPSNWAYTDDVYVDEIDGEYYLIDPVHPGIRLLIVIGD
ncbi:MAG TPA: hypothetical protein VGJ06_00100 [Candidatus Acidoferrum sp.]